MGWRADLVTFHFLSCIRLCEMPRGTGTIVPQVAASMRSGFRLKKCLCVCVCLCLCLCPRHRVHPFNVERQLQCTELEHVPQPRKLSPVVVPVVANPQLQRIALDLDPN